MIEFFVVLVVLVISRIKADSNVRALEHGLECIYCRAGKVLFDELACNVWNEDVFGELNGREWCSRLPHVVWVKHAQDGAVNDDRALRSIATLQQ